MTGCLSDEMSQFIRSDRRQYEGARQCGRQRASFQVYRKPTAANDYLCHSLDRTHIYGNRQVEPLHLYLSVGEAEPEAVPDHTSSFQVSDRFKLEHF